MKVFIGGSRSINVFNEDIHKLLYNEFNDGSEILVGDAAGVDSEIQRFCVLKKYNKVIVYASNGRVRNNIGNFPVKSIRAEGKLSPLEFYTKKDIAMAEDADYGIVIWDGKSLGTFNQIYRLVKQEKFCYVYLMENHTIYGINGENDLRSLIASLKTKNPAFKVADCVF
jgi:hypothetical protein